jgi:hypothetical protein
MKPGSRTGLFLLEGVKSTWFLGRWAAFVVLGRWMGWHYRLGWLFSAFGAILAGFLAVVLGPGCGPWWQGSSCSGSASASSTTRPTFTRWMRARR